MVVGMSTACFFPDVYTEQAVTEIGKMQIRDIEVFFSCYSEYQMPFAKQVWQRAQDSGINIYSIHALSLQFEPQLFSRHERARKDSYDIYRQVLEAGAQLGAGVYVFHGPAHVKQARTMRLDYAYIGEYLDPIAEMAKSFGIRLAYENVHWCWYREPDFPALLAPHITTDNLYYTLDIKQAAQAGHEPSAYIDIAKDRLLNVHLCDHVHSQTRGIAPRLPFDGETDWERLKQSLTHHDYGGPLIMEVYRSNYEDNRALLKNYEKVKTFFE